MALYERAGIWYCDVIVKGRRIRKTTKETNERKAKQVEIALRVKAEQGKLGRPCPTLKESGDEFIASLNQNDRLTTNAKRYYRNGWRLLRQTKLTGMRIDLITNDDVITYGPKLSNRLGAYSINNAIRMLRRLLNRAKESGQLHQVPELHTVQELPRETIFTKEQEEKLLSLAPHPLHDVAGIILDTGMRPEEVFRMQVRQIDFTAKQIYIEKGKTRTSRRYVPLSDRCMEALRARTLGKGENDWVFPSKRSKSGHIVTVEKQFLAVRRAMGLDDRYVLYCARHTFGTMIGATGNLKVVMQAMGHSDVKTTFRYQHPDLELIRNLVNGKNAPRVSALLNGTFTTHDV